ncbi:hypothetical protein [Moraxella lacunata]|uniref:hypothetical protein n=1 Tax=Moraxella lacunata TaxID=477 RepID=UPI003EDEF680
MAHPPKCQPNLPKNVKKSKTDKNCHPKLPARHQILKIFLVKKKKFVHILINFKKWQKICLFFRQNF